MLTASLAPRADRLWTDMEHDLCREGYSANTRRLYVRCVRRFMAHCGAPSEIGTDEVRRFIAHLVEHDRARLATVKLHTSAIKFLFKVTLRRPGQVQVFRCTKTARGGDALSLLEVERLLEEKLPAAQRLIVVLAYRAGLRIVEACRLQRADLDLERGLLQIRGPEARTVPLDVPLATECRRYLRAVRLQGIYLFPGPRTGRHVEPRATRRALRKVAAAAGVGKRVYPDRLRHVLAARRLPLRRRGEASEVLLGHDVLDGYSSSSASTMPIVPSVVTAPGT
jgi:integrase/recombinase XerD